MLRSKFKAIMYQYQADHPDEKITFAAMSEMFGVPVWFLQALWHDRIKRLSLEYAARMCEVLGIGLSDLYEMVEDPTVVELALEVSRQALIRYSDRKMERGQ